MGALGRGSGGGGGPVVPPLPTWPSDKPRAIVALASLFCVLHVLTRVCVALLTLYPTVCHTWVGLNGDPHAFSLLIRSCADFQQRDWSPRNRGFHLVGN